jgi:XRE family transcriptional regulator, regulator of sulfur utilization
MKNLGKKLGSNIRECREKKQIGVNELARILDVSRGYLSQIETGAKFPTIPFLHRISKALDTPLGALFEGIK